MHVKTPKKMGNPPPRQEELVKKLLPPGRGIDVPRGEIFFSQKKIHPGSKSMN